MFLGFRKNVMRKKELEKVPSFILLVDPNGTITNEEVFFLQQMVPESSVRKLSAVNNDGIHFLDKMCKRKCKCVQPDLVLLVNDVFRFTTGCFMIIGKAEILFSRKYSRSFFEDSLAHFSACEIRNGL